MGKKAIIEEVQFREIEEMNERLNEPESLLNFSRFLNQNGNEAVFVKKINPIIVKDLEGEELHLELEAENAFGEERPQHLIFRISESLPPKEMAQEKSQA